MNDDIADIKRFILVVFFALIIAIILILIVWITESYFQAKTFNRLTCSNITTFEAMFVELRIQEQPNRKELK